MPELPEVEAYRQLALRALDRTVSRVEVRDERMLAQVGAGQVVAVLTGTRFTWARRIGKLLLLDSDNGPTLGLHFGMTGRLVVDGAHGVDELIYASRRLEPAWDRFAVFFDDGGSLVVSDPRLLGRIQLDPDESRLGPDALGVTGAQLRQALATSAAPLKARLMDQARLAGIGNLLADEILWRASLSPQRAAGSLSPAELRRLHHHLRRTLDELMARGGSHTGDLMAQRAPGGHCPRDGAELRHDQVGGRSSWWCPRHQS